MDHRTIVSFFTCQLVWVNRYAADTFGSLDEGYAAQAQAEAVKAWQGRQ